MKEKYGNLFGPLDMQVLCSYVMYGCAVENMNPIPGCLVLMLDKDNLSKYKMQFLKGDYIYYPTRPCELVPPIKLTKKVTRVIVLKLPA